MVAWSNRATFLTSKSHSTWLDDIRHSIWDRVTFENEMVPSDEALFLHWKRSCWVLDMWRQADQNIMTVKPVTQYG